MLALNVENFICLPFPRNIYARIFFFISFQNMRTHAYTDRTFIFFFFLWNEYVIRISGLICAWLRSAKRGHGLNDIFKYDRTPYSINAPTFNHDLCSLLAIINVIFFFFWFFFFFHSLSFRKEQWIVCRHSKIINCAPRLKIDEVWIKINLIFFRISSHYQTLYLITMNGII